VVARLLIVAGARHVVAMAAGAGDSLIRSGGGICAFTHCGAKRLGALRCQTIVTQPRLNHSHLILWWKQGKPLSRNCLFCLPLSRSVSVRRSRP
jgi:hypothetical protein